MELPKTVPQTSRLTKQQELFERIVARFECDWQLGCPGRWQDYLPEDTDVRELLTMELPLVEEEFRQRSVLVPDSRAASDSSTFGTAGQTQDSDPQSESKPVGGQVDSTLTRMPASIRRDVNALSDEQGLVQHLMDVKPYTCYGEPVKKMKGGLGDVWVVSEANLGRTVAVKQLQERWVGNPRAERAFLQEVRITSLLEHPGIVPVHATGRTNDGRPFYSMRYIEGETLREAIDKCHAEPTLDLSDLRRLLDHFVSVCQTVAYAHSCQILHRDLKPENVVIGSFGQTVLLDWGLAKQSPEHSQFSQAHGFTTRSVDGCGHHAENSIDTSAGDVLGTPAYMSPEQARGDQRAISTRTDVYGLGAILYTILFGLAPHPQHSLRPGTTQQVPVDFPAIRTSNWLTSGLIAICRKAMSVQPGDRYPSAAALADEVVHWLSGESISVKRQPLLQRSLRWAVRQRTLAGAVLVFAIFTLLAMTLGYVGIQRERSEKLLAARTALANARAMESAAEYIAKVFQSAEPVGFDNLGFAVNGQLDARESLRQILENGYALIDSYFGERSEQKSNVLLAMGYSFRGLAEYEKANNLLNDALALRRQLYGENDLRTLECIYHLGRLASDRGEYAEAEQLLRHVVRDGKSETVSAQLLTADAQFHLAWLLYYQPLGTSFPQFSPELVAESKQLFSVVIKTREQHLGANHPSVGLAYAGYAAACFNDPTQVQAGLTAVTKAMEVFRASSQQSKLGHFLVEYLRAERFRADGDAMAAHQIYCQLRETIEEHLGRNHPVYLVHLWNMVGFYRKFQRWQEAEHTIDTIRKLAREIPGFRSSQVHLDCLRQYIEELMKIRPHDAIPVLDETLCFAYERPDEHQHLIRQLQELREAIHQTENSQVASSDPAT